MNKNAHQRSQVNYNNDIHFVLKFFFGNQKWKPGICVYCFVKIYFFLLFWVKGMFECKESVGISQTFGCPFKI